jgi:nucleotide-binding universal stress UspA family protein
MATKQKNIIVPTDFSEQSVIALQQSYNLARHDNAAITLLHVIDEDLFSSMFHVFSDKSTQEELYRTGIQVKLQEMADDAAANSGLKFNTRIEKGKIYEQVVKVAADMDADFIIMGTMGAQNIKKKFIGSNAIRVISEAHCPVITIKGTEHHDGCKTILLPLDLSKETKEKVVTCIEIANFFNSEIKVMSVIDTSDEFLVNKLTRQMDQVIEFIASHNLKVSGSFMKADKIAEGVMEYAEQIKADLIIIMTQQELVWTEFFIGTESQKIINHSTVPVCSIRPIERKDTTDFVIT